MLAEEVQLLTNMNYMTAYWRCISSYGFFLCSKTRAATSYLFISQRSRGFEWGCGAQAAERPGLADLRRLQGPATDGTEAAQVRQMSRGPDHAQRLAFHSLHGTVKGRRASVGELHVQ